MNKLPKDTVKLIKSGQVVTSVSCVIKELIENAIDAGATNVDIKLTNFGLDCIEVKDNGGGVAPENIELMVAGHYTSKISSFDDLSTFESYGFRGEALHSLCTVVSELEITSKRDVDVLAKCVKFESKSCAKVSISNVASTTGTTIKAVGLFDNLPVRKNFYKKGNRGKEDLKKVESLIWAFGLIHPGLRLSLSHNKCQILVKTSTDSLLSAAQQAFGVDISSCLELIQLEMETNVKISLLTASNNDEAIAKCSRSNSDKIFISVNQRPIVSKPLERILKNANDKYPVCVILIDVPQQSLDVNLEPNKTSVMIEKQQQLFEFIKAKLNEHYYVRDPVPSVQETMTTENIEPHKNSHDDPIMEENNGGDGIAPKIVANPNGSWSKGTLWKNVNPVKLLTKSSAKPVEEAIMTKVSSVPLPHEAMPVEKEVDCTLESFSENSTKSSSETDFFKKPRQPLITSFSETLDESDIISRPIKRKMNFLPESSPVAKAKKATFRKIMDEESFEQVDVFLEKMREKRHAKGEVGDKTLLTTAAPNGPPVMKRSDFKRLRQSKQVPFDPENVLHKTVESATENCDAVIGQLIPSGFWIMKVQGDLMVVNHHRLQEVVVFNRLMQSHALPSSVIARGPINIIGNQSWNPAYDSTLESLISDPRLTLNGLKIKKNDEQEMVLIETCSSISFMGISDLVEIAKVVKAHPNASIEKCRPLKVRAYLKSEAVRMSRQMPTTADLPTMQKFLAYMLSNPHVDVCLHSKPLFHKFNKLFVSV